MSPQELIDRSVEWWSSSAEIRPTGDKDLARSRQQKGNLVSRLIHLSIHLESNSFDILPPICSGDELDRKKPSYENIFSSGATPPNKIYRGFLFMRLAARRAPTRRTAHPGAPQPDEFPGQEPFADRPRRRRCVHIGELDNNHRISDLLNSLKLLQIASKHSGAISPPQGIMKVR